MHDHPTSAVLKSLAASEDGAVEVRAVLAAMGSRAHGIVLILFALPETVPLPFPSLSAFLGIPLVLVAAHLVVAGEGARLPERVLAAKMPSRLLHFLARYLAPVLEFLELATRPRLLAVMRYERLLGLVCLYLSVVLLLPIPLVNVAPALCLVGLALGMVQRDGLLVILSLVGTVLMTLSLGFIAQWLASTFGFGS
jgi:hypothetical protein